MKILAIVQGAYGERIVNNVITYAPQDWEIVSLPLSTNVPHIIDEPEDFIPPDIPPSDLLLFLSQSDATAQLIPAIARQAKVKGVIAPIENNAWFSQGLKGQVKDELLRDGIGSAYPKNFCTLTKNTYGYRESAESYECEIITEFANYFGQPAFKVDVDPESGILKDVEIVRCSPCGSTHHAVNKMKGLHVDEVIPRAGLICMQFRCLASMQMEHIDKDLYNTLMHLSGQIFNDQFEPHLEPYYSDERRARGTYHEN